MRSPKVMRAGTGNKIFLYSVREEDSARSYAEIALLFAVFGFN